jgi:hypothetical protein
MRLIYMGWLLFFITACATKKPEYSNIAADETIILFNIIGNKKITDARYQELITIMPSNYFMLFDNPQELPSSL